MDAAKLKLIDKEDIIIAHDDPSQESKYKRRKSPVVGCGKVCMICRDVSTPDLDLMIFVLDLNDDNFGDGFVPRLPTLRLTTPNGIVDAVCVMDSTLFLFEGSDTRVDYGYDDVPINKSVFTYDLSPIDHQKTFNLRLNKTNVTPVGQMLGPKRLARATPTPDGKILVFSAVINYCFEGCGLDDDLDDSDLVVDFELFDPKNKTFTRLPGMWPNVQDFVIGYALDFESTLYLAANSGLYSLPLESLDQQSRFRWLDSALRLPSGRSVVIGDETCLCEFGAFDLSRHPSALRVSPLSTSLLTHLEVQSRDVTLLSDLDEDGQCVFCVSLACLDTDTRIPHVVVDVCTFDLEKHCRDGDGVRVKKCFKLVVGDKTISPFHFVSSFPLRDVVR